MNVNHNLLENLIHCNIFKVGNFKLKSGSFSPIYIDLRQIINYPHVVKDLANAIRIRQETEKIKSHVVCGVPYTALPIASVFSVLYNIPMLIKRKEAKDHGTKKMVEGNINPGDSCLIIEDIVSSGTSVIETANTLREEGLKVEDCIVVVNRNQGGSGNLKKANIKLHYLFDINEVFETYCKINSNIQTELILQVQQYFKDNSYLPLAIPTPYLTLSYAERSKRSSHKISKALFELMELKQTNLCVAVDTNTSSELLDLANQLGPHVCALKTHIDILDDFSEDILTRLQNLSKKHNFFILEDRKFADIGNTVKHQFFNGIYKIQSWADMVTVHAISGEGIIEALKNEKCACILVAEMSSKGALTNDEYRESVFKMAENHSDCVIGYVAQKSYQRSNLIHMCPGVNISSSSDSLGQQYNIPENAISNGADIIIVGRGIYASSDVIASAIEYKTKAYDAYLRRISNNHNT